MHLGRWQSLSKSPLVTLGLWNGGCVLLGVKQAVGERKKCVIMNVCGRLFLGTGAGGKHNMLAWSDFECSLGMIKFHVLYIVSLKSSEDKRNS